MSTTSTKQLLNGLQTGKRMGGKGSEKNCQFSNVAIIIETEKLKNSKPMLR